MHFAVVADKMDLSSSERRLEKEKYNFIVSFINQDKLGLTGLHDSNVS